MELTRRQALKLGTVGGMSLFLFGCGGSEEPAEETTDEVVEETTEETGEAAATGILGTLQAMSDDEVTAALMAATGEHINLSGITDPNQADRSDIAKGWPHEPGNPIKIGWTEMSQANPWFVAVKNSAESTAAEYGYDINFQIAENDVATQSGQVDNFIQLGVDVIVIDPCDVSACAKDIERAVEAGIPVICIGSAPSKATNAPILTTLSDNAYEVGFAAGKYAGTQFAGTDINMACVPGQLGNTSAEARVCGIVGGIIASKMEEAGVYTTDDAAKYASDLLWQDLKSAGKADFSEIGLNILAYGEGQWSEEGGLAAAEPILTANGDKLNLMVADNEFQCFGILRAIENVGLTDQIQVGTCADGTNVALQRIADGELLMSGSWNGDQQGSWTIHFIHAIFEEGKDPNNLPFESFFEPKTFTAENAAEWINDDPDATFFAVPEFEFPASIA